MYDSTERYALSSAHAPELLLVSRCPPYPLHLGDRLIPYHLSDHLHRRGYQMDLLAFYQQPEDLADVPLYEEHFQDVSLIRETPRNTLSLLTRALLPGRRFPKRQQQSWSPEMWRAIQHRLDQRRVYDVVHLFGGIHVYEFRDLLKHYPTIIAPYESYSLYLLRALEAAHSARDRLLPRLQLTMARRYESWMFEGYQRVVVVSDQDAQLLSQLKPGLPLTVIPNGVDEDHFVPTGFEPDTPGILFTGNYEYAPNVDAAMRLATQIFPQIKQAVPTARLMLVGHNPPSRLLALQSSDIYVPGRVPDLRPYFESAMLYLSPLRLGAGIKNKILEAMAMQTAVVATPLSCDGINVTNGENVILAKRGEDLAAATIRLLQDTALRHRIAANGRALIEAQYTWRRVVDAYEQLYEAVISEHRAKPAG